MLSKDMMEVIHQAIVAWINLMTNRAASKVHLSLYQEARVVWKQRMSMYYPWMWR
jgi:hypothetical protein